MQALTGRKKLLGSTHVDTLMTANNYGSLAKWSVRECVCWKIAKQSRIDGVPDHIVGHGDSGMLQLNRARMAAVIEAFASSTEALVFLLAWTAFPAKQWRFAEGSGDDLRGSA